MSKPAKVQEVAGMAVLAGPIATINARIKQDGVAPRFEDPVVKDWNEQSSPDDWGVPYVYDYGAYRLLAAELERWATEFGGAHGEQLRRRAAWLLSAKIPGADT